MAIHWIGLLSPPQLTRFTRGKAGATGVTGAETAGMAAVEAVARKASLPCRLYADHGALSSLRSDLAPLGAPSDREVVRTSALGADLAAEQVSVVHTYGADLHSLASVRAALSSRIVPLSCMQYSISQTSVQQSALLPFLLADLYSCDAAICTTEASRTAQLRVIERQQEALRLRGLEVLLPIRHEVIAYPIDTEYFRPPSPEEKRSARQSLGLPLDGRLVLYVGRFDPASKSDLQPLLLAFRVVLKQCAAPADVHLILAGYDSGGQIPILQRLAKEYGIDGQVAIHTDYPPSQQVLYYQAADVFASLSDTLQENFGLTPVEAMSCGLPVVVSDWAGYQETVLSGETGFRVKTLWAPREEDLVGLSALLPWTETHLPLSQAVLVDPLEVAHRLTMLLEDAGLRARMGAAARAHVEREYAARVVVARMEALWAELVAQAKTIEKRPVPPVGLYETPFGHDLAPYAAGLLPADARLLLTEYGREVLGGKLTLPLSDDLERVYPREATFGLLQTLRAGGLMNRGLPRGETAEQAARKYGLTQAAADRCLTWLVKHGLACVKGWAE